MQHVQAIHAESQPAIFKSVLDAGQTTTFFEEVLSHEFNVVLVAETDGEVAGYVWCQDRPPADSFYAHSAHVGYIDHVSIDPGHRRRGTGAALIAAVLKELKRRGATRVGVDFWSFNEPARSFFAKLGFSVQREVCSRDLL
jgi:ribosomal protein S18 acetylase RimI-like enzyme